MDKLGVMHAVRPSIACGTFFGNMCLREGTGGMQCDSYKSKYIGMPYNSYKSKHLSMPYDFTNPNTSACLMTLQIQTLLHDLSAYEPKHL